MEKEEKEFYQALQELKDNLQQIESARNNVKSIVKAYNDVGSAIRDYGDTLADISKNINELCAVVSAKNSASHQQMEKALNKFTDTTQKETALIKESANDFQNKVDAAKSALATFTNQTRALLATNCDTITAAFRNETGKTAASFTKQTEKAAADLNAAAIGIADSVKKPVGEIKEMQEKESALIAATKEELLVKAGSITASIDEKAERMEKSASTLQRTAYAILIIVVFCAIATLLC